MWFRKGARINANTPKRPVVINLSTNSQPAQTALILFSSYSQKEIQEEIEKIIKDHAYVIPSELPRYLQKFGEIFTEWDGVLIDVVPDKPMMNISSLGPVS